MGVSKNEYCPIGYRMAENKDYIQLKKKASNYIIIMEELLSMQLDKMYLSSKLNENNEVQVLVMDSSLFSLTFSPILVNNNISLLCKCLADSFDSSQFKLTLSPLYNLFIIGHTYNIQIYSNFNILLTQLYFLQDQSQILINTINSNTLNLTFNFTPLIIGCSKIFIHIQISQSSLFYSCFQYFSQFPSLPQLSDNYLYSQMINPVQIQFNLNISKISKQNFENNQYQIAVRQEGGVYLGFSERITKRIQVIRLTEKWKYQWGQQIDLQISGKFLGIADTFVGFAILYEQQESKGLRLMHYDYVGNQIFNKSINNNMIQFFFQNSSGLFLDPQFDLINYTIKANLEVCRDLFVVTLVHSNFNTSNIITIFTIDIWNASIVNLVYYQANSYLAYNVIDFKSLFDRFQYYYLLVHSLNNLFLFQVNIFQIQTSFTDPFFNLQNRIQQAKRDKISQNFNNTLEQQQFQCGSYSQLLSCLRISSLFSYNNYIGFFYSSYKLNLNSSQGISNEYNQLGYILYHQNNMTLAIQKTIINNISNITNIKQQQISDNVFLLSLIVTNRTYQNNISQPFLADDIDYSQDKSLVYLFDIQKNLLLSQYNQYLLCNQLDEFQRTPNNNIVWSFLENNQLYLRYLNFDQQENYMQMLQSYKNIQYMGIGTQLNQSVYQNETKYRSREQLIWFCLLFQMILAF